MSKKEQDLYAVEMEHISKIFGSLVANDDITLRVKKGEIHAIIGENGAGKSTLMSILFGLYQPTRGSIKINGKQEYITDPIKANRLGLGMVHQHFKLVDIYSILDNIVLGDEITRKKIFLNRKAEKYKIAAIASKYNLQASWNQKIATSSVGAQQRTEILKLLYRNSDILVLDEPTAVLTPQEIEGLLKIIRDLKADNKTIIFISHKLDEVKAIADSATVIRRGKVISTFAVKDKTKQEMAELMVGRSLVDIKNNGKPALPDILLEVKNLSVKKQGNTNLLALNNFNLQLHAGEIVAIAGVEGNGQTELVQAISGLSKISTGHVLLNNIDITHKNIASRYDDGLSHVPEDRQKYGLILDFNLIDNSVLQNVNHRPFSKFGLLNKTAIQLYAQTIVNKYDVRGANAGFAVARGLSGGNQQKLIIGREMVRAHNVLLIVQPTRGLDVGAIEYIHEQILLEKAKGNAILLVSYELDEILSLADRIVIVHKGQITGEVNGKNAKQEEIGLMMAGIKQKVKGGRLSNATRSASTK